MHNYAGFGADTAPVHAKTEFDKNTRGGIINTKCIVISKIQGAQIGWNHRTVYALPSESEEFVSGKSKRRLQGAGMNSSYKGNSISMGILLPFFVTIHEAVIRNHTFKRKARGSEKLYMQSDVGSCTGAVR